MSVHPLVPVEIWRGPRFPENGVTDGSELPCGCWESNPGSLEEQGLLTAELCISPTPPDAMLSHMLFYNVMLILFPYIWSLCSFLWNVRGTLHQAQLMEWNDASWHQRLGNFKKWCEFYSCYLVRDICPRIQIWCEVKTAVLKALKRQNSTEDTGLLSIVLFAVLITRHTMDWPP